MIDQITITLVAGNGGDGRVNFRRERYVPRGGPDGGDGGKGGDVVIVADPAVRSLDALRRARMVRAEGGEVGGSARRHGRTGRDTTVNVPVGTLVWDAGAEAGLVGDLVEAGQRCVIARGGLGGRGNARMATAMRQAPRIAERGLAGDRRRVRLELRLVAEAGLVGLPNAGKTSLLRAVSAAKAKVGAYAFTTLEPNIGVAEVGYESIVVADVPGLIEGAHAGAGLGTAFLQHARRTSVLVVVADASVDTLVSDVGTIRDELVAYGEGLGEKPWIVALNKVDVPGAGARAEAAARALRRRGIEAYAISALTGEGVAVLMEVLLRLVQNARREGPREGAVELAVLRPGAAPVVEVRRTARGLEVTGERALRAAAQLGGESEEARLELGRRLRRMGAVAALRRAGAKEGDRVKVGDIVLEWPL